LSALLPSSPIKADAGTPRSRDLFGHPRGLSILFTTEMWERFSYAGMSSLLALYLVQHALLPGQAENIIGYGAVKATLEAVYGVRTREAFAAQLVLLFTGIAYSAPIIGGYVADRYLGQRLTAVIGALLMAAGHFLMMLEATLFFALACLIAGIGAFKPNVSTQVGALYAAGDERRVRAYSIYYLGINIGTFLAPLTAGTLGQTVGWHYGFGTAGAAMLVATAIYLAGLRHLPRDEVRHASLAKPAAAPLTASERQAVGGLICVFVLVSFYWAAYSQQDATTQFWAETYTDRRIDLGFWQGQILTAWFLSIGSAAIFVLTPAVIKLWAWQATRGSEPSTIGKMAIGFACMSVANILLAVGALTIGDGKASPWLLVGYFVIVTVGELYVAPVGLALVSRLAPAKVLSLMMGLWFAASLPGGILGSWLGGLWDSLSKPHFFLLVALAPALAGLALYALRPVLRKAFEG
jgi:POT family proton-dependent oligopeptide transporter